MNMYVCIYIFFGFYWQNLVLDFYEWIPLATVVAHENKSTRPFFLFFFSLWKWCCGGLQIVIGIVLCFGWKGTNLFYVVSCRDFACNAIKSPVIGFWGVKSSTNPCKIQYYGWHFVPYKHLTLLLKIWGDIIWFNNFFFLINILSK